MTIDTIDVFQKQWAFTSSDSSMPKIRTGCFGPCIVVTLAGKKFAALAHIDDTTQVDTIKTIFKRFADHGIEPKNISVAVMGGWRTDSISRDSGQKILTLLAANGFEKINRSEMFSKKERSALDYYKSMDARETEIYYHFGALVDSTTGETYISEKEDINLSLKQLALSEKEDTDKLQPLKEVAEGKSK